MAKGTSGRKGTRRTHAAHDDADLTIRDADLMNPDLEGVSALLGETDPSRQPDISRRGFLALAAGLGTAAFLPSFLGGPVVARADDTGGVVLYVLKRDESAFTFKDVADPKNPVPIPGATVSITSHHNDKTPAAQTTDAAGVTVFAIKDLSEPSDPQFANTTYRFWGSISISKDGYRTFETGLVRIEGANRFDMPTVKVGASDRYIQRLTFDGYDIQYSSKDDATFITSSASADPQSHTLSVKANVRTTAGRFVIGYRHGTPDISGFVTAVKVADQKVVSPDSNGIVSVDFDDIYLGSVARKSHCFLKGLQTDVFFRPESETSATYCASTLVIEDGCISDLVTGDEPLSTELLKIAGGANGLDVSAIFDPKTPVFGGMTANIWYPTFPVKVEIYPYGKFIAGVGGMASASLTEEDGVPNAKAWGRTPKKSGMKQINDKCDDIMKAFSDAAKSNSIRKASGRAFGKMKCVESFDFQVSLDALAELDWGQRKEPDGSIVNAWGGSISLDMGVELSWSFTSTITIGPIPVFLTFVFTVDLDLGGNITVTTPKAGLSGFVAHMSGTGVTLDLKLDIGLTLGVGIPGILNGGVYGNCYIRFYIGFVVPPDNSKSFPHALIGYGFKAQLVIQALIFKANVNIYKYENPKLADSWAGSGQNSSGGNVLPINPAIALPTGTNGDPGCIFDAAYSSDVTNAVYESIDISEAAQPVTQDELERLCEQVGTATPTDGGTTYVFSPLSRHTGETIASPISGIDSLGVDLNEAKILSDVFSDPRCKVVAMADSTVMFRLGSVKYVDGSGTAMRSRICISQQGSDGSWVDKGPLHYEYDSNDTHDLVARKDIFDYDFDVTYNSTLGRIYLLVIGGTRAADSEVKIDDESQKTILMSVVLASSTLEVLHHHECLDYFKPYQVTLDDNDTETYSHALMFPHVMAGSSGNVVAGFLHRRIAKGGSFYDGKTPYEDFPAIMVFDMKGEFITRNGKVVFESPVSNPKPKKDVQLHMIGSSTNDGAVFSFITYDEAKRLAADDNGDVTSAVQAEFMWIRPPASDAGTTSCQVLDSVSGVSVIRPWDALGGSVAKRGSTLCEIRLKRDSGAVKVSVGDPFLEKFGVDSFDVSSDGSMVYFTKIAEGEDAGTVNPDGSITPTPDKKVYQVFSARKVRYKKGQRLTAPYPYARLDHAPADIVSLTSAAATNFMYSSITAFAESKADIYFATVPVVNKLDLVTFSTENTYVCAGTTEPILFTVQNLGNTIVSEFDVEITENGAVFDTVHVKIDPNNTLNSPEDILTDKPTMTSSSSGTDSFDTGFTPCEIAFDVPTENGVLMPGKKRTYRASFDIPSSWQDDADKGTVKRTINAYIVDGSIALAAQGDDGFAELDEVMAAAVPATSFGLDGDDVDPPSGSVTVLGSTVSNEGVELMPNYYSTGSDDNPGGSPSGSGSASGVDSSSGAGTPNTGDGGGAGIMAALGLALGAVGLEAARARGDDVSPDEE